VNCRLIVGVVVDTFDNVNLATLRPVWTVTPKSRPSTTTSWHVNAIHDEKPSGPGFLSRDTYTLTVSRDCLSRIDLHESISR